MALRLTALSIAFVLAVAAPALAQEEEVYQQIEDIQGDADGFFELFSALQDAAMFGDPTTIAQYANYPLLVNANGESYDVLEEQDLLDNFDTLVSPETLQALLEQDVADLIVTSEGVGIGNGAMWLSNFCVDDACEETYWGIFSINN
ncbi:hypothetical protein [Devosia rhizoryzae]|uniref:Uncharacterized protein n=1 Tax=Devosia rhizoryzae TaxID=2774137 RepID=A0ABX7C843_9HYPH|nr:hypothetical protein [Devosia rhizoryzae]QQR39958.1 hypothetical protein JI748_02775 [Devosia rhizoryzae]